MKESLYYLFLSGLILGSGPCLSVCGPVLISFVAAYRPSLRSSFFAYVHFSLAKISAYMVIGALLGIFSGILKNRTFQLYANTINLFLGFLVLFIGLATFVSKNHLKSKLCSFLHKGNFRNVGIIGFLTGLSPCLPLIGIFNYIIIISHSPLEGIIYSLVFGLGTTISPVILLIGLSGGLAKAVSFNKKLRFIIKLISSLVLIIMGLGIVSKALYS